MITGQVAIVQYLLILAEVVDGGTTGVHTYILTVSTTTTKQYSSMVIGIRYHLLRLKSDQKTAPKYRFLV